MRPRPDIFITAAALLAVTSWFSPGLAQTQHQVRDRLVATLNKTWTACKPDLQRFCGAVTPGGGRVMLCMRAFDDQLATDCKSALNGASQALDCWKELKAQCAGAGSLAECLGQKKPSLSQTCQYFVTAAQQRAYAPARRLIGLPVYSWDGQNLGAVTGVRMAPDGGLAAIEVEVGNFLGLGPKTVLVNADALDFVPQIRIRIPSDAIPSLPDVPNAQQKQ